ncbi:MAG: hypothetical protein DRP09_12360 [Candidatus Thorarchaeota archaeon]|nr:MAG: hypothetical protein DRP09_12360 [Candidatus Thorarchaeota archaeon]
MTEHALLQSDWPALRSVYFSATLCSLGFFMINFMIPIIVYSIMGGTPTQVALVFSMLTLGSAVFSPIAGRFARRGRRRASIFIGASVRALTYAGIAFSIIIGSVDLLIINSLLWGLGAAFYVVGMDAEISERVLPDNRSEAFGRRQAANGRGSILGGFVGFTIIMMGDNQIASVVLVLLVFAASNILGGTIVIADRRPQEPVLAPAPESSFLGAVEMGIVTLIMAAALDTFISALLAPFVELYILSVFTSDIVQVGLVYLPAGLISAVLGGTMGRIADHSNKVAIVSIAVFMGAVSTLGLVFIPQLMGAPYDLWAVAALFAFSNATSTMAFTVMSSVFGTAYQGRASKGFGLYEGAMGFSRFSAPIVGGFLWENVSPATPFVLVGLSGFLLIPLYATGMRKYEHLAAERAALAVSTQDI